MNDLTTAQYAARLAAGSAEMLRRTGRWITAAGWQNGIVRTLAAGAGGTVTWLYVRTWPSSITPILVAWYLGAAHLGRRQAGDHTADDADDEPAIEADGADEGDFLAQLHHLMADTDRIHLAQVADHFYGDPDQTAPIRDLCTAVGVTITRGVRVPDRGVSTGIHRKHLPPLPLSEGVEPRPAAVVAAGQGQQQQQQHGQREGFERGFISIPDPDGEPNQTLVIWPDQAARHAS